MFKKELSQQSSEELLTETQVEEAMPGKFDQKFRSSVFLLTTTFGLLLLGLMSISPALSQIFSTPPPRSRPNPTPVRGPRGVYYGRYAGDGLIQGDIEFSPNGLMMASGAADGTIWIRTADDLQVLEGHKIPANSLAFSPDGQLLASAADDLTIRLWQVSDGSLLHLIPSDTGSVTSVAFSPDGQILASASVEGVINLWNVQDATFIRTLAEHPAAVNEIAFSPDGESMASAVDDGLVWLWRTGDGELVTTLPGHTDRVTTVAFSPDGALLASGSADTTVRLWSAQTLSPLAELSEHTTPVSSLDFSPDGQLLASSSRMNFSFEPSDADLGSVNIWQVSEGSLLKTLTTQEVHILAVRFSPDGRQLAVRPDDNTVELWQQPLSDAASPDKLSLQGSNSPTIALSPTGLLAVASNQDIRLWDVSRETVIASLVPPDFSDETSNWISDLVFSPDGALLVSVLSRANGDLVYVWQIDEQIIQTTWPVGPKRIQEVDFVDNDTILTYNNPSSWLLNSLQDSVDLWIINTGQLLDSFEPQSDTTTNFGSPVTAMALSPDKTTLALGTIQGTVELWQIESNMLSKTLSAEPFVDSNNTSISSLAFSPDNKWLAAGLRDEDTIRVWNVSTDDETVNFLYGHTDNVNSLTFYQIDENVFLLASAGSDGTVGLWSFQAFGDSSNGALLYTLEGHRAVVRSVAFAPHIPYLVSGSSDGTTRIWWGTDGTLLNVLWGQ